MTMFQHPASSFLTSAIFFSSKIYQKVTILRDRNPAHLPKALSQTRHLCSLFFFYPWFDKKSYFLRFLFFSRGVYVCPGGI